MTYRNVCRAGRSSGGRVRQDDVSITNEILPLMSETERQAALLQRRANPSLFRQLIDAFKTSRAHQQQIQQIIENHNAQGASPGILRFIREIIENQPKYNIPPRPADFYYKRIDTHPGRHHADVHLEGRAADVYYNYHNPDERRMGDWLFDYCVANCHIYKIQGVIFGRRQWYSEMNGGQVFPRTQGDHDNHVHIELNCDGANLR